MLNNFFRTDKNIEAGKGMILISEPLLDDYYFKRSIIILTEHTDEGSIGFVINNLVDVKIVELIPKFPSFNANISIGGPVETDSLQFIHSLGNQIQGSTMIQPGLYWGGDFNELTKLIKQKKVSENDILFFLGYSGWSPNQLDDEINRDSWVVTEMSSKDILSSRKNIWKEVIMKLGDKQKVWANFPDTPDLN